jgi:hypothetical protein
MFYYGPVMFIIFTYRKRALLEVHLNVLSSEMDLAEIKLIQ